MKVQIKLTVDVDVAAWCVEYGCERSEVREDVKTYLVDQIRQSHAAHDFALIAVQ